jgi:hypothetical protein
LCVRLAARQFGVIARSQAIRLGMSSSAIDRRVQAGEWIVVCRGVYRIGTFPIRIEQTLIAGCLWGGDGACASHRAAAALWRLDGIPFDVAEITIERNSGAPIAGLLVHRRSDWLPCDRSLIDPFSVTDVTRTLVDLGTVVAEDRLEMALDSALRRRMTSVKRLAWRIEQSGTVGRKGAARLAKLLEARGKSGPLESPLEVQFARAVRRSGLPPPTPQYEITSRGQVVARVDFAYPDVRLAIELDGYEWHHGRARWQRDLGRRSRLAARGWRVMHFTAADLRDPAAVVAMIRTALEL